MAARFPVVGRGTWRYGRPNLLVAERNRLHELARSNATREQAKANARAHYGLPAAFYRLWLDDPLLMYTCAYWKEGVGSLEDAQAAKIDHVCRKLRLLTIQALKQDNIAGVDVQVTRTSDRLNQIRLSQTVNQGLAICDDKDW